MGQFIQRIPDFFEDRFDGDRRKPLDYLIGVCAALVLLQFLRGCSSEGGSSLSFSAFTSGFGVVKILVLVALTLLILIGIFGIRNDEDDEAGVAALRSRRSGTRLVIIGAAVVLGLLALFTNRTEEVRVVPRAAEVAKPPPPVAALPTAVNPVAPTPAVAERPAPVNVPAAAPAVTRESLIRELEDLRTEARLRWRRDIESADATGMPGVMPPMLTLTEIGEGTWLVKNISTKPACVRLGRIAQTQAGGPWIRCSLDIALSCHEVRGGQSRRFVLGDGGHATGCRNAKLEYRVGTPLAPEPSWWSRTALQDFDLRGDPDDGSHVNWTVDHLRGEVSILREMLAEPDRAARWRRELGTNSR